jgi:hypothetical protein
MAENVEAVEMQNIASTDLLPLKLCESGRNFDGVRNRHGHDY